MIEYVLRDRARLRRLPAEFGRAPIFASAGGGLGAVLRPVAKIDPILLATAKSVVREGNVIWDVGANIGLFSVAAAALAGQTGHVVAFEPDVVLVQLLRKTGRRQGLGSAPIAVVPCAVADRFGLRRFEIAKRARASNALFGYGRSQMGDVAEIQTVVALALDDCVRDLPPPDVLKIDVEGAELEVLSGASRLLHGSRPVVVCEVGDANVNEASILLSNAGYELFDGSKLLTEASKCDHATWNTIAVPREKKADLVGR